MNNKIKKIDKRIVVIYVVVILLITVGIAYALKEVSYAFNTDTGVYGIDETAYGETHFNSANLDLKPILDSDVTTKTDNVIKIDFTVGGSNNNPNDKDIIYDIALNDLDIDCELLSSYVKWKLVKNGVELSSGNLSNSFDTIVDNRLILTNTQVDLPDYSSSKTGYDNYSFYLWVSDSCQSSDESECFNSEDQSSLLGKSLSGKIEVELNTGFKKTLTRYPSGGNACSSVQKVLFDTKGGEVNISSKEIVNGKPYGTLPTPTRENYTFDGWHLDEEYTLEVNESSIVNTSGNIVLYAKWVPINYNITYNLSNCTTNNNPSTYNIDTPTFILNDPICPGYTFNGWTGSNGNSPTKNVTISKGTTGNKTYNVNKTPNTYKITFNSNNLVYGLDNKSSTTDDGITYTISNGVVTVTSSRDDGYGFTTGRIYLEAGVTYYFNCDTNGIWGSGSNDTVEAFLMLSGEYNTYYRMESNNNYAFTPTITGTYWLRLDVNKSGLTHTFSNISISTIIEERTLTYGNTLGTLPTPTRAGFPFSGWYSTKTGGTEITANTSVPPEDTTYYALWGTINKVKIQFSVNGGSWAGSTNTSFATDSGGYVTLNGSRDVQTVTYGGTLSDTGLYNYNNSSYINISRANYSANLGEEWICLSGCTTTGKVFNQATVYNSSDFCDASSGNCTVVLGVNWVAANYEVSGSGVTTAYFMTLADAHNYASSGNTIKVLKDVTEEGTTLSKNLTLNTNSKTMTMNAAITVSSGTLTINGSGTLKNNATVDRNIIYLNGGSSSLSSVALAESGSTNTASLINNSGSGSVTLDNVTANISTASTVVYCPDGSTGNVTINSGTYNANTKYVVRSYGSGTTTIAGGTLTATSGYVVRHAGTGTLNVTGGTLQVTGAGYGIIEAGSGNLNLSGGTIKGTSSDSKNVVRMTEASSGTLTLNGSTISSAATAYRAISILADNGSNFSMTSGTITCNATGGCLYIDETDEGLNDNGDNIGTFTISGGTISSSSGGTAGSDSLVSFGHAKVKITGGVIANYATGSAVNCSYNGLTEADGSVTVFPCQLYIEGGTMYAASNSGYAAVGVNQGTAYIGKSKARILAKSANALGVKGGGTVNVNYGSSSGIGLAYNEGAVILSTTAPAVHVTNAKNIVHLGARGYAYLASNGSSVPAPRIATGSSSAYTIQCGSSATCTFRGGRIFANSKTVSHLNSGFTTYSNASGTYKTTTATSGTFSYGSGSYAVTASYKSRGYYGT